ncbi:TonB-dependent siderophore receptor [Marinobacter fonticola]|uniref:TonB-dependent siderophore receptor n=1 Tax=Marinobacter fonticola TaxID=2603215 RepID=UPI0011E8094B|nr:TonB-dependent siderophore receptor [Marinobacter fonticola]
MTTPSSFPRTLLSVAVALSFAPHAQAQEGDAVELDALTVYSETYRNTATKTALEPGETPQSMSVLDREALEMRDSDSVASALRYASGVNTELRGGAVTRMDLFNIRSFINYQNYYDGLVLLYNDWNLQPQIDLMAVEQIEVFKGPTSTLYGSMAPGGMVNLISKKPDAENYNRVEVATGSHDLKEGSFESTGQLGDTDLSYSVVGLARSKDGQAKTSEEERIMLAPQVDWRVSEDTLVNFNLYYQKDPDLGVYNTLPAAGLFQYNPNGKLPVDSFSGDANWDQYTREVTMLGYKINHRFTDRWTFLHNFRYTDASAYQENTYSTALGTDRRTLGRRAYLTDEETQGVTVDNQLSGLIQAGEFEHNVLIGVDYLYLDSNIQYEDAEAPTIDLFAPNYYQINPAALDFAASGYTSDFDLKKEQLGLYLQDQIRWNQWVFIAGTRFDHYRGTEKGIEYGAQIDRELEEDNLSSRAGMLYEFSNGISPFVSYSESFQPESGTDRFGNEFDPSTGKQWETGIKYAAPSGITTMSLAAFHITKENVEVRDPGGTAYDTLQAGEVRSRGIEFEAQTQPIENLRLSMAYTYTDAEVTEGNSEANAGSVGVVEGTTPVWVPEHMASAWADYSFFDGVLAGLNAGMGVRYIGEAELDASNTDQVPDATLLDLALGYDLGYVSSTLRGASIGVSVNNATDERYYSCYDGLNCWFGAERTVEASLAYTF